MSYLIPADYNRLIQDVSLNQIISGNNQLKILAENAAIEEAKSFLRSKYDTESEFTNTTVYDPTLSTYKVGNRVYLTAPYYSPKKTYALNDLAFYAGNIYKCTTIVASEEEFDINKWGLLGAQYSIFYAIDPYPVFDLKSGNYKIGDKVYWRDKTYVCKVPTSVITHEMTIQYNSTTQYPYNNIFPDATGADKFWESEGNYTIAPDSLLDTTKFTLGDNRNQQLVLYVLDMLIYHLYRRIPPQVVPEIRILAYQNALSWFGKVAKGNEVVADIRKIQPVSGERIRYGSRPKQQNFY